MLPLPRGTISRADSRPARKPAQHAISQTFRNTRSVVSRIGKLTLAPTLKMQTSSGAALSASLRKAAISSSLRASSERPTIVPPAASTSFTSGSSFSPLRRPANTVKPSAANFLAISAPIKSPAPITAHVALRFCKVSLLRSGHHFLDVAQLLLAEKHFLADEEGRRTECAALHRRLRVLHQLRLDLRILRAREQFCRVQPGLA